MRQKGLKNMMVEFDMGCFKVYAFLNMVLFKLEKAHKLLDTQKYNNKHQQWISINNG